MRLANLAGRAVLLTSDTSAIDVETASRGRFGPDLPSAYERWEEFAAWARTAPAAEPVPVDPELLGPPSPRPQQVFGIGLNYRDHAAEAGLPVSDDFPAVFTKFASSLTGPFGSVTLPAGGHTDWEVEVVLVIGRAASQVSEAEAWDHVAGVCVGQDLSERIGQFAGSMPQFNLGKSLPRFGPTGPWLVPIDELPDRDDLRLGCSIDGDVMQDGRTRDLIWPVSDLVAELSRRVTLLPGDLIFTGTPAGTGIGHEPRRFLRPGEVLRSWIDGVGHLEQTFVEAAPAER